MHGGDLELTILKQCKLGNMPIPEKIRNAPDLHVGLEVYYLAFWDLVSGEAILWERIEQYAIMNNFDLEQKEDLHYFIPAMNSTYITWSDKNAK